jgi:hypothetical protein
MTSTAATTAPHSDLARPSTADAAGSPAALAEVAHPARVFQVPSYVFDSMERRAQASQPRTCIRCPQPALRARGGGASRCEQHDIQEFGPLPVPDPARTLDALRARAGIRPDAFRTGQTSFDRNAQAKGQQVSAARRAQARGQVGGEAA